MDLVGLWEQANKIVRLSFRDGEVVDCRILATDPQVHADLTYEVIRIHQTGAPQALGTAVGAIVVASTDDILGWHPVVEERSG